MALVKKWPVENTGGISVLSQIDAWSFETSKTVLTAIYRPWPLGRSNTTFPYVHTAIWSLRFLFAYYTYMIFYYISKGKIYVWLNPSPNKLQGDVSSIPETIRMWYLFSTFWVVKDSTWFLHGTNTYCNCIGVLVLTKKIWQNYINKYIPAEHIPSLDGTRMEAHWLEGISVSSKKKTSCHEFKNP